MPVAFGILPLEHDVRTFGWNRRGQQAFEPGHAFRFLLGGAFCHFLRIAQPEKNQQQQQAQRREGQANQPFHEHGCWPPAGTSASRAASAGKEFSSSGFASRDGAAACRLCRIAVVVFCIDRKSTRLNSSHVRISYAVFCLKKKKTCISERWE